MTPDRRAARDRLLADCGFDGAQIDTLAADASFRSYDRAHMADGRTLVVMNAPPDKEDVRPFARIAGLLEAWDFSAPRILGADEAAGFLVLEDLGDDLFSRLIERGHDAGELYAAAVDLLVELAGHTPPADLPAYDLDMLVAETDLLIDWRYPEVAGHPLDDAARADWHTAWRSVLAEVGDAAGTLVLRDYHVDNLIWLPSRAGLARVGLLDFQDAVRGHPAYDVASLLSDVRRDVPPALEAAMLDRYIAASGVDGEAFRRAYTLLAAQRNAKIVGIFTRLWRRDGKARYLDWLPRTWALLRRDLADPALEPVAQWFDNHIPQDPAETSR
ncbi:MAG: aminoglycoside phosphotransferase family protein [Minwuia sp.]|uniref:aminoglycoside phosphotransferase family protein n=1 Tax=Minwuia sp. TaxID=2493630 RepID=UPI003A8B5294